MFCRQCGKEISDQAKFCNYCGAQVNAAQSEPAAQPKAETQSCPEVQPKPAVPQQSAAPKKKGGKRLLSILVGVVVFFAARFIAENMILGKTNVENPPVNSGSGVIELNNQPSLTEACAYGALYKDGYLTYGMTKLNMPGYSLLPGEGGERDWLVSQDGSCLFAANKQLEVINIAFEASNEEEMLQSFKQTDANASMVSYEKLYINNYPVIRYIVRCTVDGSDQYAGEAIVFPGETAKETIRLSMWALAENGYGEIDRVFDSLNILPQFAPGAEDTQVMGFNRITVK